MTSTEPSDDVAYAEADDGVRLAYRVVGDGPPRVLAPALSWLAADLEPLTHKRAIAFYDIRGQGRSDAVPDTALGFERDLADLDAVRRALGQERIALLGWSYYGAVCARYAWQHPDRTERMALLAPVAPRAQPHWRGYLTAFGERIDHQALLALEQQRRAGLRTSDPHAWCRAQMALILGVYVADQQALTRMRACPCVPPNLDPEAFNRQTLKVIEGMGHYDWRDAMHGLTTPTAIWHGDRDPVPLEGSREWQATLSDATLHVLPDCGHMPWLEQPDTFFSAVDAFLP